MYITENLKIPFTPLQVPRIIRTNIREEGVCYEKNVKNAMVALVTVATAFSLTRIAEVLTGLR